MKKSVKKWLFFVYIAAVMLISTKYNTYAAGNIYVDNLKVNGLTEAFGQPLSNLRFSWEIQTGLNNVNQTEYHVVFANTRNKLENQNYSYDSGWVKSRENTNVTLGYKFSENQLYYWKVQVKDNQGNVSDLSEEHCFSTEVGSVWKTNQAIWSNGGDFAFFRWKKSLDLSNVEKVLFSTTATSPEYSRQYVYNLYVNGQSIGVGPTRLDGNDLYYNVYDITDSLTNGQNVIGCVCYAEQRRAFLGQLICYYKDGTKKIMANTGTDRKEWTCLNGDEAFGNNATNVGTKQYYTQTAENLNSSKYPKGWLMSAYNDKKWTQPNTSGEMKSYKLCPYKSGVVNRYRQNPAEIRKLSENRYVIDFGNEMIGNVSVQLLCLTSQKWSVGYGEELNSDGSVKSEMRTGNIYRETWNLTPGYQEMSTINMKAFRYMEISGCTEKLSIGNITGWQVRQKTGNQELQFSSNNSILNDEYNLAKRTIENTSQDMYVDTQSRERQNYAGDTFINMMTATSMNSNYSLSAHSIEYALNHPTWPSEYMLYTVQASWKYYLYSGDIDFLNRNYSKIVNCMKVFSINGNGWITDPQRTVMVDWPASERDGYEMESAYYNTVLNAIYCGTCTDMANIAEYVGKTSEASYYRNLRNSVKASMIQKAYNPETGRFSDGLTKEGKKIDHYAQHATAFSLANQVYESQGMAVKMADSLKNEGINKMSVYGTFFLLQGLYNSNQGVLARQIMSNPSDYTGSRTWANMMYNSGATLTTEAWDSTIKSNMSYSHAWGSAPGTWLIQGLFGIKPTEPGWNEAETKLQPGGVEAASVSVPTTKGKVSADYKIEEDGSITLQMKIPSNMKMKIMIPGTVGQRLRINGTETEVVYNTDGYLETTLYGGSYLIIGGQSAVDTSELKECQNIVYRSCGKDWSAYETDGGTTGTKGKSQSLHKIQLRLNQIDGNVKYSVHVNSKGWLDWKKNGESAGEDDKIIQAVKVELEGNAAVQYDIYYRTYCQNYGWLDWAKNGEIAGTIGMNKRVEAFEVKLIPKNGQAPGETSVTYRQKGELSYSVHCQSYGWMSEVAEGTTAGTSGQGKRLEAIKINAKTKCQGAIQYQVHVQSYGWMDWKQNGTAAGTSGKAKRLEAIRIRLTGEMANKFDVYYRVHAQSYGWLDWAKNGEGAGTQGKAKRLEAIQIVLVKKNGVAPGSTQRPSVGMENHVSYTTHVQSYGWQSRAYDGEKSGTEGKSKRLEGIRIKWEDANTKGGIRYRTHVQSYGWQGWQQNDQISGTTGQAKRLEAIQIELTGDAVNKYDVYYRVHCQSYGWLGWAKNGDLAGSSGMAKRLEAIEIKVVPKGESVDVGGNAYYSKEQTMDMEQDVIDEEQPSEEITQEPGNDNIVEEEISDSSDNKDVEEITGEDNGMNNEERDDESEKKSEEKLIEKNEQENY